MAEFPSTYFTAQIILDYQREYERLKTDMQADHRRAHDQTALRRALDRSSHDALIANRLYLAAKQTYDLFEKIEHPRRLASLRKAALAHFEEERAGKIKDEEKAAKSEGRKANPKTKAPTEKMVEDHMMHNLDEWAELERKKIDLQTVRDDLKCFAESWMSRTADIRMLCKMWQPPSNYMPDGER